MKKNILLFFFICFAIGANSQNGTFDDTQDFYSQPLIDPPLIFDCSTLPNPENNYSDTPIKTYRINFHFMRRSDGSGIYQPGDTIYMKAILDEINSRYTNLEEPEMPVSPPAQYIDDSRFRFDLKGIYFHDSTPFYDTNAVLIHPVHGIFAIDPESVFNVFFYTNSIDPIGRGYSQGPKIFMQNIHVVGNHNLLTHELGHSLCLPHTFGPCFESYNWECFDDVFSDTYFPDCSFDTTGCGPLLPPVGRCTYDPPGQIGVSNNIMGYNDCRTYLSPMQLDTVHEFAFQSIRRKYISDCYNDTSQNITIIDTVQWNSPRFIGGDVIIENGGELQISCFTTFTSQSKIIVKPGGKLVVEDATLTNICNNELWDGIEVWGYPDTSQFWTGVQGQVELYEAVIEHATYGVLAGHVNDNGQYVGGYTGGMIRARNTQFQDNYMSIAIMPYQNIHPTSQSEVDNWCRFDNCQFDITSDTLVELDFNSHVYLAGVVGVKIRGCSFDNNRPLSTYDMDDRGMGIKALSSSFYVTDYCLDPEVAPCDTFQSCLFQNLTYGVKSVGVNPGKTCTIEYSEFIDNLTGVYLSNIDRPTIILNDFEVFSTSPSATDMEESCGLYLDDCDGYQVEENNFESSFHPNFSTINSIGIVANNSGVENNDIYNNTFSSITDGIIAQNVNRDTTGDFGLQIRCNDFSVCEYDIAVTCEMDGDSIGIRYLQGSNGNYPDAPANNLFSYTWDNDESDYYNGCQDIIYYHLQDTVTANTKPKKYSDPEVNPTPNKSYVGFWDEDENCPSNLTSSGGGDIESERSKADDALIKTDSLQNLLGLFVDGGNTTLLNSEIQTSFPDEALEVHGELLDESPYLSDTVMISAIRKEDVLTPVLVTDVLVANPQAAKSSDIQNALDNRIQVLSDDQRTDVDQGWFVIGAKESLESSLAFHHAKRRNALNNVLRLLKTDTNNIYRTDSVLAQLAAETDINKHYEYSFELLSKGDNSGASAYINSISVNYTLSSKQMIQNQQYTALLNLLIQNNLQGKSFLELNNSDISTLHSIYNNSKGRLRSGARNLLSYVDSLSYSEPYILPSENFKSGNIRRIPVRKVYHENIVKVYPNPARNYFIVEYSVKSSFDNGFLIIRDNAGKPILTHKIEASHDYMVFSTNKLSDGLYFCNLVVDGNIICSEKLIITK